MAFLCIDYVDTVFLFSNYFMFTFLKIPSTKQLKERRGSPPILSFSTFVLFQEISQR